MHGPRLSAPPADRRRWLPLAAAILTLVTGATVQHYRPGPLTVVVDAEIDQGTTIELFHNDLWTESQRLPIRPGRQQYRFVGMPARLWSLRLDPSDSGNGTIRIHSVTIQRDGRVLEAFAPTTIAAWSRINLAPAGRPGDTAEFRPTSPDPILYLPGRHDHATPADMPSLVLERAFRSERFTVLIGVLFLLAGLLPWRGRQIALAAVGLPAVAILAGAFSRLFIHVLGDRLGGIPSVAAAVGIASYVGYPKVSDFRAYWLAVLCCVAIGLVGAHVLRKLGLAAPPPPPEPPARTARLARLSTIVLLVAYALTTYPVLPERLNELRLGVHWLDWDQGNIFTWQYMIHRGWLPFRDFWYPYGGFSAFEANGWFPWGYVLAWGHDLLLLAVAGWSLHRALGDRPFWAALCFAGLLGGAALGFYAVPGRYFLSLDVVLLGLAASRSAYRTPVLVAFVLMTTYAFLLEPNQVLYATPPLLLLGALDLRAADRDARAALARRMVLTAGGLALGVAAVFLCFAVRGQLGGFLGFLEDMQVMSVYGSIPAAFDAWFHLDGNVACLVLWGPLCLIALGCCAVGLQRRPDVLATGALMLGLVGAVSFNKFLVRPHIAEQIVAYSVAGVILALGFLVARLRQAQWNVLLLAGVIVTANLWPTASKSLVRRGDVLRALPASIGDTVNGERRTLEMAYYEDRSRYPDIVPVLTRLDALGAARAGALFDLGDDSVMYVARRERPPYFISFYNSSPIRAQQTTVQWLDQTQPEWVVWRPSFVGFDGVPNLVRVPLLFDAVIASYRPVEQVGEFEILRRSRPGDAPDLDFWSARLGSQVDLGAVPAASGLARSAPCQGSSTCADVLRVRIPAPRAGNERAVEVVAGEHRFRARFSEVRGQRDYWVHLDRLWFYGTLRRLGQSPVVSTDLGPGAEAERLSVAADRAVLW
jgi:hypothetical protein